MTKFCSGCMKSKPLSEFHDSAHTRDGKQGTCKSCKLLHRRSTYFYDRYGITMDDYVKLCKEQNDRCAICNELPSGKHNQKTLHVDHDYKTGKVRGLLCGPCNLALGGFRDSVEILIEAVEYLNKHGSVSRKPTLVHLKKQDG